MLSFVLTEINILNQYVKKGFISQAELDQLDKKTQEVLKQEIVFNYVQQQKISIDRIKTLTTDECQRLANYSMKFIIDNNQLTMEEYLTLSSRRAIVLSSIHVILMRSYDIITGNQALRFNNTFEFFNKFHALREDVLAEKVTPEVAIQIHEYFKKISVEKVLEHICQTEPKARSYNLPLSFNPTTATEYCALIDAIPYLKNAIAEHRNKILSSSSKDVRSYITNTAPSRMPTFLNINLQQKLFESNGYKEYCSGVMTSNFKFFQLLNKPKTPLPQESDESLLSKNS